MAVTAKFQADFTSFQQAVQKAEVSLRSFETGAGRVEKSLNRMADSFSGRKIIQDATLAAQAVEKIGGATNLTEKEQRQLNAQLTEALAKYKALGLQAPQNMLDLAKATAQVPPQLSQMDRLAGMAKSTFGQMFGAFSLASIATGLVSKLTAEIGIFIDRGLKLPAVQGSFERLAQGIGQDSQQMLSTLQASTKGMVSNIDLMLAANKAMLLGLPVTTESMGELAKTATVLGKAMGQDATKSFDDLITALGRSSPMILDNLGLTVKLGEANEAYAAKLGKTAEQLTDAEKKMAFYEAAMEAARKKTAELGDQTKTLGEIVTTAWTQIGNVITEATAGINIGMGSALSNMKNFATFLRDLATQGPGLAVLNAQIREGVEAIQRRVRAESTASMSAEEWAFQSRELSDTQGTVTTTTNRTTESVRRYRSEIEATQAAIARLQGDQKLGVTGGVGLRIDLPDLRPFMEHLKILSGEGVKIVSGLGQEFARVGQIIDVTFTPPPLTKWEAFGERLGHAVMAGITSGNFARTIGEFFGNEIFGPDGVVGKAAQKGLSALFGQNGIGGMLGSLLGSLVGPLGTLFSGQLFDWIGKLFDQNKGRDLAEQFAQQFGGFDALREKLNDLGDEGERLWKQLTQGKAENDPRAAQAAIDAITAALERQKIKAEEAGAALTESQNEAVTKVQAQIDGLTAEYDRLWESIKDEAPEEVMGVVEQATRARMDAIVKEREAAQQQVQALMKATTEAIGQTADAIDRLADSIMKIKRGTNMTREEAEAWIRDMPQPDFTAAWRDTWRDSAGDVPGFARGTSGRYLNFGRGTLAMLHGRERIMTEQEATTQPARTVLQPLVLQLDGREMATALVPLLPGVVERLGLVRR